MGGAGRGGRDRAEALATARGGAAWRNLSKRSWCCDGNESVAVLVAFSAQLVPAGENGGGWGGVRRAAGGLVYPAVTENFWLGCQRGNHAVRPVRVRGGKEVWDVIWLREPGSRED